MTMRRILLGLGLALAMGVVANPVDAQFKLGVHGDYIAGGFGDLEGVSDGDFDLSGDFGIGGRVAFGFPALPIGVNGDLTYYFPDCGDSGDCSYWTAQIGAQAGLPLVLIKPYILGGWQWQSFDLDVEGFEGDTKNHPFVGLGVEFNVLAGLFVEGQWEFTDKFPDTDFDVTPFVIKAGIMFGG
jgi:opacity protein-like surface antigen